MRNVIVIWYRRAIRKILVVLPVSDAREYNSSMRVTWRRMFASTPRVQDNACEHRPLAWPPSYRLDRRWQYHTKQRDSNITFTYSRLPESPFFWYENYVKSLQDACFREGFSQPIHTVLVSLGSMRHIMRFSFRYSSPNRLARKISEATNERKGYARAITFYDYYCIRSVGEIWNPSWCLLWFSKYKYKLLPRIVCFRS